MKILIAEDDEDSRVYLQRALESKGHEVEAAEDGLVALKAIYDAPPDIIISDIMMPKMDGFVLCRNIKGDTSLKDIPFIFYTATYLDPKDRELGLALGASRYLEKPMELSELLKAIEAVMEEVASSKLTEPDVPKKSEREIDDAYGQALARKLEKKIAQLEEQYEVSKQNQQKLRQSEERFRDFAESSSDWFWEMDEYLRFTHISEGHRSSTEIDPRIYIGKTRQESSTENSNDEKWLQHFDDMENHRPFRDFTFELKTPDGIRVTVRTNGKPVIDHDGVFRGYRGTGSDITELKMLEAQLHQSQKMEAVGQLTGGIAHDFNNLLNIVMGKAELLSLRVEGNEKAQSDTEAIIGAVQRAASLTERLLAFSRQQTLSPQPTAVNGLIVGLEDMLQRTLGETVELNTHLGPGTCLALIDPHQFENALINLAVNARHAMPDGGVLTIETATTALDATYAEQHEEVMPGEYVEVMVSDTGTGMSPEVLERVFDPFFTTKDAGEGSGLGLSMVYGFAKQSNGHITIDSEEGHGTTVKLYLPRSHEAPAKENIKGETPKFALGSERILVVEDDGVVREVSTDILRNQGYEVFLAKDGEEAIAHLKRGPSFDLLFTDIVLPGGMNGVEIAKQAKRLQPGIKVLYTTGYADDAFAHNDTQVRDMAVINKPYRRAALLEKVQAILNGTDN